MKSIVACVLITGIILIYLFGGAKTFSNTDTASSAAYSNSQDQSVAIHKKWQLPEVLREISGLVYIDNDRFACVQDEEGKIFVYNAVKERIEEVIEFGGPDDYEGIAVVGTSAFVVNSSGQMTEVKNYRTPDMTTVQIATPLTAKYNIEGLCYDSANDRLLLAVKDRDINSDYKGVYAYDLSERKFITDAVFKIALNHSLFGKGNAKRNEANFNPSGISIHPITKEIYIVDGRKALVLILNKEGQMVSLIPLVHPEFSQPEGITFDKKGTLYISNEGVKNPANILKVSLN
jgi:uncharacterized protein YjiK